MQSQVFQGIINAVPWDSAWVSLCAVHEEQAESSVTEGADGVCGRGHGSGFHLEPADSSYRTGAIYGAVGVVYAGWHSGDAGITAMGALALSLGIAI